MDIVGITGHAQNGKDSFAEFAGRDGYKRYAFADNVRRSLYALNPVVAVVPNGEAARATLASRAFAMGASEMYLDLQALVDAVGWDEAKQYPNVRRYLQRQGTEAVRDIIASDAWVMALKRQLDEELPKRVVISDVRFPNESAAIRSWGGAIVRLVRLNPDGTHYVKPGLDLSHPSEAYVSSLPVDAEFLCQSLASLRHEAEEYFAWRAAER